MSSLISLGKKAKEASYILGNLSSKDKNDALYAMADSLIKNSEVIIEANKKDLEASRAKGTSESMLDRLALNAARIEGMANGLRQVASLEDPVGEVLGMWTRPNGLQIGKKRVPMGVIGIIYEARPNVTSDAAGLCFKSGNAVILRGGSEAINSNKAVTTALREGLKSVGLVEDAVQLVEDTSREVATEMMKLNDYIDVLIPRGGKGLKKFIIENATIPVIETGAGVCHVFVDETAKVEMALPIVENAKTQRPSTCNSIETVLVHRNIAEKILPVLTDMLIKDKVELRYSKEALEIVGNRNDVKLAEEEDFGAEYLDMIMSLKLVDSVDEAIDYINSHSTQHSDSIITENIENAEKFLNEVNSAAVYLNASTRFSDGGEFGFGGEIGISTQKLHARGPMGIRELTTTKYVVRGNGQVRK